MWVRLDDNFTDHPKVVGLGDRAFRAHVNGLCYAAKYLTDGYLPAAWVARWESEVESLTKARLWHLLPDGSVQIHDFSDYNPLAEPAKEHRAQVLKAKQKGGKSRAQMATRNPDGTFMASGTGGPR